MTAINYRTAEVDGLNVFYREAGAADGPTVLPLHRFPSAGHMFRDLVPLLAARKPVICGERRRLPPS